MKKKSMFLFALALIGTMSIGVGCNEALLNGDSIGGGIGNGGFINPGDNLGGGGVAEYIPEKEESNSQIIEDIQEVVTMPTEVATDIPEGATQITKSGKIETAGVYYIDGATIDGKINIKTEGVTLYLKNATLTSTDDKVINGSASYTLTLIGENTVQNTLVTEGEDKNAIDCDGDLTINGEGSLSVTSTKNGISGNSVTITGATISVQAEKDGVHAEIAKFDDVTEAPTLSYDDGGYVYLDGANLTIDSLSDGIQADSFFYSKDSTLTITTNGGAPTTITETSSDNGEGKGIKVGALDWGEYDTDLEDADYYICIDGGTYTINANDDAIHSNNSMLIKGGTFTITTGDDGIHADELLEIEGGTITVNNCYEGIEAAKIEISGGTIDVTAVDDGINAADGTTTSVNVANNNCHMIISGGDIKVNAQGDGLDSNGSLLISGGKVIVSGSTDGSNAALDADGNIIVNGGSVFATGALGMVETPASNSAQYCVSFAQSSTVSAGTILTLVDAQGNVLLENTLAKACQSIIISCPELVNGGSYSIYGGDTELCTFTVSSIITSVGSSNSIGNPSNRPSFGGGRW